MSDLIKDKGAAKRRISPERAARVLEEDLRFTEVPAAMSYYALSIAVVEKKYEQAVSLCIMAVGKEFYNPDIYLNLGKIYLMSNRKALAMKAFKKGLKIDNAHQELWEEVKTMGMRRRPPISFLSRKNIMNKVLGLLKTRCSLSPSFAGRKA